MIKSLFRKSKPILLYDDRWLYIAGGPFISLVLSLVLFGDLLIEQRLGLFLVFTVWVFLNVVVHWTFYRTVYLYLTERLPAIEQIWKKTLILIGLIITFYLPVTLFNSRFIDPQIYQLLDPNFRPSLILEMTSSLAFLFAMIILYEGFYLYNLLKKKQFEANLLEKEKQLSQYEKFAYQIQPHFLFNNLNNIKALFQEDPKLSNAYLEDLMSVYHYILRNGSREAVPLTHELEFIEQYVRLQKLRFEDSFRVNFDLSEADTTRAIVPVAIQIAIENALKHNRKCKQHPLIIEVVGHKNKIIVRNTYAPKKRTDSTGIGIENLRMRYAHLGEHNVFIKTTEEHFEIHLPLIEQKGLQQFPKAL